MVYKVDVVRRLVFVIESEGASYEEAKHNALYDLAVPDNSTENEAEELRTLAQLIDEGKIVVTSVLLL